MDPNDNITPEPENSTELPVSEIPAEEIPVVQSSEPEIPVQADPVSEIPIPEDSASEIPGEPAAEPQQEAPAKKASPYANSPYYSYNETPAPRQEAPAAPEIRPAPAAPKAKKKTGAVGRFFRGLLCTILILLLVAGACNVTAWMMDQQMDREIAEMEAQMNQQLALMQQELDALEQANAALGTSGSPLGSNGSLSPSQVYAQNVNSVVAITSYRRGTSGLQPFSTGSGFILTEDGYVVTNYHVVEGGDSVTVTTYAGKEYDAELVGYDELNDVALLKMDATGFDPVTIGSSSALIVGDQVVAIGNPLGELTSTQTVGYISGKDRAISTDGSIINMLQTDAAINSGNSGGPLFNMKGEVIGITTAKYSGSSASGVSIEGIGFAIPIDDVMSMIDDLQNFGYLKNQAYLGVIVMEMDATTAQMYSLPTGSYVQSVEEGSCAERAGIQPKDIIIGLGGNDVTSHAELTAALRKFSAGDTTTITVYRSGQEIQLEVTFDERPQSTSLDSSDPTEPNEMPENGNYEEWYNYFAPFFGDDND